MLFFAVTKKDMKKFLEESETCKLKDEEVLAELDSNNCQPFFIIVKTKIVAAKIRGANAPALLTACQDTIQPLPEDD